MTDLPCPNCNLSEGQTSNTERDSRQAGICVLSAETIPNKKGRLDFSKWTRPSSHLKVCSFLTSTHYQATEIKGKWYWHKDRRRDQWSRADSLEVHLIFTVIPFSTRAPRPFSGEKTIFSINGGRNTGYPYAEGKKWTSYLTPYGKSHPQ